MIDLNTLYLTGSQELGATAITHTLNFPLVKGVLIAFVLELKNSRRIFR